MERSAQTMTIQYCRDHGSSRIARWLRGLSIDVNYDFRRWRKHQRATRHLNLWTPRNLLMADNIRRLLFPDLAWIGASSSLLCYYNVYLACPPEELTTVLHPGFNTCLHPAMLALPMECFTVTSVALGLLVTFKTQMGYGRFLEGRNLWGTLINESRALSSRILVRVPSHGVAAGATVESAKAHALKLIRTFPVTLKYHLTEDGCNPHIEIGAGMPEAELRAATAAALGEELHAIWDMEDAEERALVERILAPEAGNRPLHVLHELSHINATVLAHPSLGGLDAPAATEMDRSLTTFHNVLGACEKILRTPIYTPYTKFTSRFLWMWCNTLPLAMFPVVGPLGTVPVSLLISFFMLGIEDIGSRVEQPFDVMPLWQYCQTIDQSCQQLVRHSELLGQPAAPVGGDEAEHDEFEIEGGMLRSYADPLDIVWRPAGRD